MTARRDGTLAGIVTLAIAGLSAPVWAADKPLPPTVDFNRDIRPILSENCFTCHGPDKNKRKADLRLDSHDGIFSTIKDLQTVVPGKPDKSELYRRITEKDADERMPDPKSNKRLSDREIAIIKKWIEQGAPWQGHWTYVKPVRPAMPNVELPGFVQNPIDRFVLAREGGGAFAGAASGSGNAHSPPEPGPDRSAANA